MMEGLKVDCFQQALGDQFCAQRETPSSVEVVAVRLLAERAFSERFRSQTAAVIVGFAYYFPFLLLQSWNGSPVGLDRSFRRPQAVEAFLCNMRLLAVWVDLPSFGRTS
jgi:hypothetical protein